LNRRQNVALLSLIRERCAEPRLGVMAHLTSYLWAGARPCGGMTAQGEALLEMSPKSPDEHFDDGTYQILDVATPQASEAWHLALLVTDDEIPNRKLD